MRWLYHALPRASAERIVRGTEAYVPAGFAAEGFVHASFRDDARASAELYVKDDPVLLAIDPRRVSARVEIAATPRGPMPHVHGPIPRDAIVRLVETAYVAHAEDAVRGTRFVLVALEGMTLLDLVGALDPISRVVTMALDETATVEVVAGTLGSETWRGFGASFAATRVRPSLADFDVVVLPGGPAIAELAKDTALLRWLASFPANRLAASVCTGSLLWAAEGRLRGKRGTSHASAQGALAAYGVHAIPERVVADEGTLTAGGPTAAIDLGLAIVARYLGLEAAREIARRMETPFSGE